MENVLEDQKATFIRTVSYPNGTKVQYFKYVTGHDAIIREAKRRGIHV